MIYNMWISKIYKVCKFIKYVFKWHVNWSSDDPLKIIDY